MRDTKKIVRNSKRERKSNDNLYSPVSMRTGSNEILTTLTK